MTEPGVSPAAQAFDAVVVTADAVHGGLREGQDVAADLMQRWSTRLTGTLFTALGRGGVGTVLSGRGWSDWGFEVADVLLAAQRRSVERLLAAQQRSVAPLLGSAARHRHPEGPTP